MEVQSDIFHATPEELGIGRTADIKNEKQAQKQPQEEYATEQQTVPPHVLLEKLAEYPSEQNILSPVIEHPQHEEPPIEVEEMSSDPQANTLVPQLALRKHEAGRIETDSPAKKIWFKPLFIVCLVSLLIASGLLVTIFVVPTNNTNSTNKKQTSPAVAQTTLYRADWSRDFDHWTGFPLWQWSQEQGGMITTSTTIPNNVIFAPYHLSTPSYTVETPIRRIAYSGIQGQG